MANQEDTRTYVVVCTSNCEPGSGTFHVRGRKEKDELKKILLGQGHDVLYYVEGLYPEFSVDGTLK